MNKQLKRLIVGLSIAAAAAFGTLAANTTLTTQADTSWGAPATTDGQDDTGWGTPPAGDPTTPPTTPVASDDTGWG